MEKSLYFGSFLKKYASFLKDIKYEEVLSFRNTFSVYPFFFFLSLFIKDIVKDISYRHACISIL